MRTVTPLAVLAAVALVACEGPAPETLLSPEGDALELQAMVGAGYRVTGEIAVGHTWPVIETTWWELDVRVDRDGQVGGTAVIIQEFSPDCTWCPPSFVRYPQEPVCLSVDPVTRQAWIGLYMWVEDWQADHWFILQLEDLAPAPKPLVARDRSGRTDRLTYRSQMSSEPPDSCLQQPDLPTIEVTEYGLPPVDLLPVREGDLVIRPEALR